MLYVPHKIKIASFYLEKWAFYYGKNADFRFPIS